MASRSQAEMVPSDVFTPREYQVELLEEAKQNNIIICLNTGSGKTFIAVLLIKELADAIRKPWSEGGQRTFFLVNTVPLVAQQAKAVEQHTDLAVGQFTGSTTLDAWVKADWDQHLQKYQVLVMSSQIFCNMLEHGFLSADRVNLLILDECHHAIKDSPMRQIMRLIRFTPTGRRPRVLGMSASIITKKMSPAKLETAIETLQKTMGCAVRTANDTKSVVKYSTRPKEMVVECCDYTAQTRLHCRMRAVADDCLNFLNQHRYAPRELYGDAYEEYLRGVPDPVEEPRTIIRDFLYVLETLGPWCADRAAVYFMVKVEKMRKNIAYERHFLLLGVVFTALVHIRTLCDQVFEGLELGDQICNYSSPKVLRLIAILRSFAPQQSDASAAQNGPAEASAAQNGSAELSAAQNGPAGLSAAQNGPAGLSAAQNVSAGLSAAQNGPAGLSAAQNGTAGGSGAGDGSAQNGLAAEKRQRSVEPVGDAAAPAPGLDASESGPASTQQRQQTPPDSKAAARFSYNPEDPQSVCGLLFVKQRITAKVLYRLIKEMRDSMPSLSFLYPQYIVGSSGNYMEPAEVGEAERKKQEEVLHRFRFFQCNLLVTTSVLEEGVDIPRCNLVVRFDPPTEYRSYVQSKGRARASAAHYLLMVTSQERDTVLRELANYHVIEKRLIAHCQEDSEEPSETDQMRELAERRMQPYRPPGPHSVIVTRNSAIALINRYCSRLPSDTFTRLTPHWTMEERPVNPTHPPQDYPQLEFRCTLRLPINSAVKNVIQGDWMPSKQLSRQSAALRMCRVVHEAGELDDHLLPIGKEALLDEGDEPREWVTDAPRPGTTKRRQYYKKRVADALSGPHLTPDQRCYLYQFHMRLSCPIPDVQNTRGRRLFRPERHPRRLGLITANLLPQVCAFPIFSRSGEVVVSVELVGELRPDAAQLRTLATFHRFVFSGVLRLEKFPMRFVPEDSVTTFCVVPINEDGSGGLGLDWPFLEEVTPRFDEPLKTRSDQQRADFQFCSENFADAVVMPWYRNQDQPQFFYVAEICQHLQPGSAFPDDQFRTFTEYYHSKYGIRIQCQTQPLLDVDHTSARLNMLTPRFVNRKGVALPAATSETKRAKRESLQQKQILVPELCTVHPFPASLWRKVVTLPSLLYRLNGVMVADGLRRRVATEVHLGTPELPPGACWPQLDFGWSLAEVLQRREESADDSSPTQDTKPERRPAKAIEATPESNRARRAQFDIGTWSNDLLAQPGDESAPPSGGDDLELAALGPDLALPPAVTLLGEQTGGEDAELAAVSWGAAGGGDTLLVRYGSPTYLNSGGGWNDGWPDTTASLAGSDLSELSESDVSDEDQDDGEVAGANRGRSHRPPTPTEPEEEDLFNFEEDVVTLEEVRLRMEKKVQEAHSRLSRHCLLPARAELAPLLGCRWSGQRATAAPAGAAAAAPQAAAEPAPPAPTSAGPPAASSGTTKHPDSEIRSGGTAPEGADAGAPGQLIMATPAATDGQPAATRFDYQPNLDRHAGPSPALILQALTMSNANDGINLERLETVGDSFLKFAITAHLYLTYPTIHEGKLSYLRSKQVSNLNLYRLGQRKGLGELMVAAKFEPHDNWLPPGYTVPEGLEEEIVVLGVPASRLNLADMSDLAQASDEASVRALVRERCQRMKQLADAAALDAGAMPSYLPYNLLTQLSIPDKSVADCVESLIGAYLVSCGPKGALVFMNWLGIKVLPRLDGVEEEPPRNKLLERQRRRPSAPLTPISSGIPYGELPPPPSPRHTSLPGLEALASPLLSGLDQFERIIQYQFRDKFYLLQAFTHASYHRNQLTDCYQRLEFLGDAVLDYLITRHLYEDPRNHSPGALTDLRSALVNNAIFATLAVRFDFHKYFNHYSPGLNQVIDTFLDAYKDRDRITEEYLYVQEEECDAAEDIEVPKALGDVFESVAGAIYLDSGMSLDAVWRVYHRMMQPEIEAFSEHVPKSPIRELLELEPDTAKFNKPVRCMNGKVCVTVEVFGKGSYKGLGRNYRIARCTAAKRALRALKRMKANRVSRHQLFMYGVSEL